MQIETQNTQLGEVIESQKITAVPLNGRSYTDLLALQPGVSPYTATSEGTKNSTSGNLNPGNQSVNGGREASNGFMVNGGNVNDGYQTAQPSFRPWTPSRSSESLPVTSTQSTETTAEARST